MRMSNTRVRLYPTPRILHLALGTNIGCLTRIGRHIHQSLLCLNGVKGTQHPWAKGIIIDHTHSRSRDSNLSNMFSGRHESYFFPISPAGRSCIRGGTGKTNAWPFINTLCISVRRWLARPYWNTCHCDSNASITYTWRSRRHMSCGDTRGEKLQYEFWEMYVPP